MFVSFQPHSVRLNEVALKSYPEYIESNDFKVIALDIQTVKGDVRERKIQPKKKETPQNHNLIEFDPITEEDEDDISKDEEDTEYIMMWFYVAHIETGKYFTFTSNQVLFSGC